MNRVFSLPLIQRVTLRRSLLDLGGLALRSWVHLAQTTTTCSRSLSPAQLGGQGGGARGRSDA